ncbi:hypothetical protein L596_025133 [Steinernema carpocapsae]|uniref:Uncharacterized protein n=1 Tax=Steinernema carpocapsae TaxID=34508 RepID=A0A4U5M6X5_STECR|nr:hypothetical protein L596_025133 [Steinernema carpocapsae]
MTSTCKHGLLILCSLDRCQGCDERQAASVIDRMDQSTKKREREKMGFRVWALCTVILIASDFSKLLC